MSSIAREHIPLFVAESRFAQGLPERVADPAVLSVVAALLHASDRAGEPEACDCGPGHGSTAPPTPLTGPWTLDE